MDDEDVADSWWQGLPGERRVQIHRWVTQSKDTTSEPIPGQLALIEDEKRKEAAG